MRRLIVLRPEPGASETVRRARERGLDATSVPLFEMEPVPWDAPEASAFDALLLTSANAVRFGGERLIEYRGLSVHAVGEATAQAARAAGFDIASSGDSGVERLLGSIDAELRLLHLSGENVKEPDQIRQQIDRVVVYRSKPVEDPDISAFAGAVILVHSSRAATRLAELVKDRQSIALVAISAAAAEVAGEGWSRVEVAAEPRDDALLDVAARLCNTSAP